jgi:hypothetical protein
MEKRALIQPRVKGPTAKKAIHPDVDNLPAPIQEETEQEQAQGE